MSSSKLKRDLPTEDEIELEANSNRGLLSIWRIAKAERRMFWVMTSMFFIISFIYSVGRVLKDGAVLSKQLPLSINFMKTFVILPVTLVCVGIIQKCTEFYSFTRIFDCILMIFAALFIVLGLVVLPFSDSIQIDQYYFKDLFADNKFVPRGCDWMLPIVLVMNEWTSSLIYVVSEMFGNLVLSYFFLTFANSLNTPGQSARFTPLFYVFSNIALLLSSFVVWLNDKITKDFTRETNDMIFNGFFIASGILTIFIYLLKRFLETSVTNTPIFIRKSVKKKASKVKVGFAEGIKEMMGSKLLLNISMIVLFYGLSTNVIESTFKNGLKVGAKILNEDAKSYSMVYNSREQFFTAVAVIILMLSPFSKMIQTKGWIYIGIVTPIATLFSVVMVCGLAFYNYPGTSEDTNFFLSSLCASKENSLIKLENILGCIAVAMMKIAKYAAFDLTKEAISMQIDSNLRPRYKGIFDGVVGKLGKSCGSLIVTLLAGLCNAKDFRKCAPFCLIVLIFFVVIWFYSVFYLHRKYHEAVDNNQPIDIDLFTTKPVEQRKEEEIDVTVKVNK